MAASERLILSTMPNGSKKNSVSQASGTATTHPRPGLRRGGRKFTLGMHYPSSHRSVSPRSMLGKRRTNHRNLCSGFSVVQDDGALLVPINVYRFVPARTITAPLGIGNTRLDPLTTFEPNVIERQPPQVGEIGRASCRERGEIRGGDVA